MGCLNSEGKFEHWFGNIHLSGPCNRSCYFCIGQHMMALDSLDVLDVWPLPGLKRFAKECRTRGVTEVNVTGTNTDPMLYKHTAELKAWLRDNIVLDSFGVRTNGAQVLANKETWRLYDKGSVTICSFDPTIYRTMMGSGSPPSLDAIFEAASDSMRNNLKVNIVLGPENVEGDDLYHTIMACKGAGVRRINLREPYGQPHIGDPIADPDWDREPSGYHLGMPYYDFGACRVTYWDVHYVEVESINLYANGTVSEDYPITRGHSPDGVVQDQSHFPGGRVRLQWVKT